ncbi:MAG TPA: hypothetical protein PKD20_01775 [Candidatus Saccharibacteria bacterium]|nr:hypothetical protein [Candidatus Saccharibacteria bacterium]
MMIETGHPVNPDREVQVHGEPLVGQQQTVANLGEASINFAINSDATQERDSTLADSFKDGKWDRSIVDIPGVQGIRLSFRGKNELIDITPENTPKGVSRFVALTPGYDGKATEFIDADTLGSWVAANNGNGADIDPAASIEANLMMTMENQEHGDVVLITDTTPLGFATLLRGLSESGVVPEDQLSAHAKELLLLKSEKPTGEAEIRILEKALLNIAVLAKKNSLKPQKALEEYLGLLIGDSEALKQAEKNLQVATDEVVQEEVKCRYSHLHGEAVSTVIDSNSDAVWEAQKSGATMEQVSALRASLEADTSERIDNLFRESVVNLETVENREQRLIEFAEAEHLVLVHKDKGGLSLHGIIESMGDHVERDGSDGFYMPGARLRDTVHFTVNHTVSNASANHGMFNAEIGIQSNAVMPLADTVRQNGLPVSLYSVDTYFDHQVKIPEGSRIISVSNGTEDYALQTDSAGGYELVIPLTIDPDGAHNMLQEFAVNFNTDQTNRFGERVIYEAEEAFKKEHNRWEQQQAEAETLEPGHPLIETYKKLPEPTFAVALQQVITNHEIGRMSEDHMVRSDGQSAFIETEGFDKKLVSLAQEIGVGYGLHTYDQRFNRREEAMQSIFAEFKRALSDPSSTLNDVNSTELWKKVSSLEIDQIMTLLLHGYLSFEQNNFTSKKRKPGRVLR